MPWSIIWIGFIGCSYFSDLNSTQTFEGVVLPLAAVFFLVAALVKFFGGSGSRGGFGGDGGSGGWGGGGDCGGGDGGG